MLSRLSEVAAVTVALPRLWPGSFQRLSVPMLVLRMREDLCKKKRKAAVKKGKRVDTASRRHRDWAHQETDPGLQGSMGMPRNAKTTLCLPLHPPTFPFPYPQCQAGHGEK